MRFIWQNKNNMSKEEKLISGSHKAKSVYLTEKGIKEAKKLEKKYLSKIFTDN